MRIVVLVLALLFFAVPSWATCTTTTANLSQATIQTAINNAIPGDTICLPAGSATWTTLVARTPSVVLNKGVTLQGRTSCTGTPVTCVDGTIIVDGTGALAGEDPLYVTGTNAHVSGISFQDPRVWVAPALDSGPEVRMQCNNCRFSRNSITHTSIRTGVGGGPGLVHGIVVQSYNGINIIGTQLIDHNYFRSLNGGVNPYGNAPGEAVLGTKSWEASMLLGDEKAAYVEDNHFDYDQEYNGAYDAYFGARLVFRYNTVKNSNMGGHGFDSSSRSTLRQEVYRNTVSNIAPNTTVAVWFQTRGGHHYVWQNTISAASSSYNRHMVLASYRSDPQGTAYVGDKGICGGDNYRDGNTPGEHGYPCRDQVARGPSTAPATDWPTLTTTSVNSQVFIPAYSWGNDFKGAPPTIANIDIVTARPEGSSDNTILRTYHILNNRDFYMEVPSFDGTAGTGTGVLASRPAACTSGVAYFATDQGSWNTLGESGLLYKCTAANTWTLYYTPYIYPHPLQTLRTIQGQRTLPGPPVGLSVK